MDPDEKEAQKRDIENFGDEDMAPEPDEPQEDEDTPMNDRIPENLL